MIKLIADQNLYRLEEFLPSSLSLTFYDPDNGIPDLKGFDAWLLRTVTKVNKNTIPDIPSGLKFVGTGSSGSDHVDIDFLNKNGIVFADALGCNARAVAEYVLTALFLWREKKGVDLQNMTYGIVGVGQVGSNVAKLFKEFGFEYVLYDPPKAEREKDFQSATLEELLTCDVLTFHVPFQDNGPYPTYHWLDEEKLEGRKFKLIINAARGGIIDESAVLNAYNNRQIDDLFIDVWEQEPDFNSDIVQKAFIATPHIAGYSEQSKLNASRIVCGKLCDYFGLKCPVTSDLYITKTLQPAHIDYSLEDFLLKLHPIKEYDAALRDLIGRPDKVKLFSKLRVDRPYRYEYGFLQVPEQFMNGFTELRKLGLKTI